MAHLLDSGALEALTPDDTGILREWAMKYAVITDAQTSQAALSIYSSPTDIEEPEVVITINGSDVQVSRQPNFERCFTVTTENGLRIFLRAASIAERDSWVESIRRAKRAATPPKKDGRIRSPATAQTSSSIVRRCCGYVFLWDEASQSWVNRYFYLSSGFLHGFVTPFTAPAVSFDLSRDCAIRMRGSPPCAEVRLGTGEIVRFTGKNETETAEWVMGIKARSAEPPQPFQGFDRACVDASRFEGDEGSLSFYLKPETIPEAMAGAPAAFLLVGSIGPSAPLAHEFSAVLAPEENDGKVLAKGSFTSTSDGKYLNLRILYHKQGKYSLWVRYRDRSIFGSPFRFTVHAGPPSATHSIVSGSGIVYAPLARKVGKFVIRLRDKFLNFCEHVDGSQLQVRIFGPAAILNITQLDPCAFEVAYRTTSQASLVQIEVGYANVPIAGSPFSPTFEEPSFNSSNGRDQDEEVLDHAIGMGQSQTMIHMDPESKAMEEAVQADLEAARTAKQVAAKAEAVSAFLSSKIRQDWAENNDQIDKVFEKNEQLELLLASSSLRANDDEPAFLRSYAVEVETGAGSIRKWEPEPLPPPWAPLSVVQAHVRHVRRDLQEAIQPLVDAVRTETSTGRRLEPVSLWKKLLLDWPGPDKATKEHISALRVAISTSPLHHRQLISAMCETVLRAEEDLHARRRMHGSSGETEQQIEDELQEEEEEASVTKLEDDHPESRSLSIFTTARKEVKDPREELRKRVQGMSLGRNIHRPFEPMHLTAERPAKEKPSGERMKRLISNETDDDEEDEDGEKGFRYDQAEDVLEEKEPTYGHETKDERRSTTTATRLGRRHSSEEEPQRDRPGSITTRAAQPISEDSPVKTERIYQIGDRVTVDGTKNGVVRHVGPTRFAPGLWIGVELDDKLGRNAGSVDGVQYFACAPLHGLFVRPDRVDVLQEGNEPRLGPGSLSHIDATELIQAFRLRQDEEGRLKLRDFAAALRSLDPNIPSSSAESLFHAFDVDDSGELDAREFVPGCLVLCGGEGDEKIQMAFKLLDVDRSGYLDKQELQLYAESVFRIVAHSHPEIFELNHIDPQMLAEESIRSAFEYCDRDADGRMSLHEFREWMHAFGGSGVATSTSSRGGDATVATKESARRPSVMGTPSQQRQQPNREFASTPQRSPPTRLDHGSPVSASASRTPVVVSALKPNQKSAAQIAADWAEVERWLTEEAAITVPFEQKATLDQFKENGFITLIRVSRLTAVDINRLNLSFDLRLRLVTKVRELAKKLVFEASERRINLSPLAAS